MIFYSSPHADRAPGVSLRTTRALTLAALLAYPAGCLVYGWGPDGAAGGIPSKLAGLGLVLVALLAAAPIFGSQAQRIVADQPDKLDEYELALRHRALAKGYAALSGLLLIAIFYCGVASDAGWWLPRSYDAFNALFWGAFLYAVLLPAALLAWSKDAVGLG